MGRRTLGEVQNGSGDPRGSSGQVWIPSSTFGRVRGSGVVQDGLGEPH